MMGREKTLICNIGQFSWCEWILLSYQGDFTECGVSCRRCYQSTIWLQRITTYDLVSSNQRHTFKVWMWRWATWCLNCTRRWDFLANSMWRCLVLDSWGGAVATLLVIGADWQLVLGCVSARIALWCEMNVLSFLDVVSNTVLSMPGSLVLSEICELNTTL